MDEQELQELAGSICAEIMERECRGADPKYTAIILDGLRKLRQGERERACGVVSSRLCAPEELGTEATINREIMGE